MTSPLRTAAEAWLADDPDPASQAELRSVIEDEAELEDRFSGPLRFGTAGLRGPLRAGPNGMNLAVVRGAAAGLVHWLAAQSAAPDDRPLVIGYDARHGSHAFAVETARVATGAGRRALLMPHPLPTPVLAFAVRRHGAAAGVMVTASHNPPQDNGYKVYLADGAQLVPPADAEIEAAIRAVGPLADVPLGPPGEVLDEQIAADYVTAALGVVDRDGPRDLAVAYTPMHGVGRRVFVTTLLAAGYPAPFVVAEQAEPDPDFPTVAFPNPEEPGATDLLLALAAREGADIAIANDPDADRCAVAYRTGGEPGAGWRQLRGDEVGVLLADHLMRRGVQGRYATTIVSSTLLSRLCADRDQPYGETLTGFKWIVRAGDDLVYGYEEALGYCVAPQTVRDKDGITAALLVCELAAGLKAEGRTLGDRLDELALRYGLHATDQLSVRVADLGDIAAMMATIRARPPAELLGVAVGSVEDLQPDADVLILRAGTTRVVVRPSGTEPKLKAYLEVVEPVADGADIPQARERAAASLAALRTETAAALGR
ncbi:phospho-sugar mutase [Dactylosporangium vinaceum]|uniref:Phospho-sugar mutase n=1 Tax=Dactylosporangium vinaceum TaxID=53362 RepID=A0ABV5MI13_9ACTN|nr:phospho-sugar mutase [Dactylosporangium vinaceum]UAB97485.1 phospho-sugar mutase [Dactylosporangium vinaceum]